MFVALEGIFEFVLEYPDKILGSDMLLPILSNLLPFVRCPS